LKEVFTEAIEKVKEVEMTHLLATMTKILLVGDHYVRQDARVERKTTAGVFRDHAVPQVQVQMEVPDEERKQGNLVRLTEI
jgi:hypothetical protein